MLCPAGLASTFMQTHSDTKAANSLKQISLVDLSFLVMRMEAHDTCEFGGRKFSKQFLMVYGAMRVWAEGTSDQGLRGLAAQTTSMAVLRNKNIISNLTAEDRQMLVFIFGVDSCKVCGVVTPAAAPYAICG